MEYYCELIAAIKVRTSNKKGRHLSTGEAIRLIEEFGIETPDGLTKPMTTRLCVGSQRQFAFKPNTATTVGNST